MARETQMNRVALSRALSEAGNPELRSLTKILAASQDEILQRGARAQTSD